MSFFLQTNEKEGNPMQRLESPERSHLEGQGDANDHLIGARFSINVHEKGAKVI